MKRPVILVLLAAAVVALAAASVRSHFQVLVPSADNVPVGAARPVGLEVLFTHPMEGGPVMEMGQPRQFGVLVGGKKTDLLATLRAGGNRGSSWEDDAEARFPWTDRWDLDRLEKKLDALDAERATH